MSLNTSQKITHTDILQKLRDTADMLLAALKVFEIRLSARIDGVEGSVSTLVADTGILKMETAAVYKRLGEHDKKFEELISLMYTHHDVVLRRIERLEDEGVMTNAVLRRNGILMATS